MPINVNRSFIKVSRSGIFCLLSVFFHDGSQQMSSAWGRDSAVRVPNPGLLNAFLFYPPKALTNQVKAQRKFKNCHK